MLHPPIFTDWRPQHARVWGRAPVRLAHRLHEDPLFDADALCRLLERYPREHYQLVQWGPLAERATWREGELGGLSGREILAAVAKGRVWINLRNVAQVDPAYGRLLDAIFDELGQRVPGFTTFSRTQGILISSPKSRTLYHADLPGQSLWQIRGAKRVFVYPKAEPFVTARQLEAIALSGVEASMVYEPWFDEHALVYDLEPGEMLHWPLNAPHRVDNHDCLNVSMTLEYFTPDIRRRHMTTVANGILRTKFGLAPTERALSGPSFWTKAVVQKVLRPRAAARTRRAPDFRLDPTQPDAIADIKAA